MSGSRPSHTDPVPGLERNVLLAPCTTLGLGGPAAFFLECASEAAMLRGLDFASGRGLRVLVLGAGSNLVVSDAGFDGLVLRVATKGVTFADDGDSVRVEAAAGEDWDALVERTVANALSGVECLSGIPGTVGATPVQNVGAYGQEVAQTLAEVRCLDRATRNSHRFPTAECGFGYRTSRFKAGDRDRFIITGVAFRLRRGGRPEVKYPELAQALDPKALQAEPPAAALRAAREAVLRLRRGKSMVLDPEDPDTRSVGSFFVNPILPPDSLERLRVACLPDPVPHYPAPGGFKVPAAWLVERAGFGKGYTHRGAGISSKHSLALVNRGGTTADLLELAAAIERAVRERFHVKLEREPLMVT